MASRPSVPDYYMVLDADPNATTAEIEKAYRKLARFWRKTRKTGVGLLAMAGVDEAYDVLKSEKKRSEYNVNYAQIKKAWKVYERRKRIAAQANNHLSDSSDDDDEEMEDEEELEECGDLDDGGPDGEAVDETWTEPDEDTIVVAPVKRRAILLTEEDEDPVAEFTDGEEPESEDDEDDDEVDRYADYATGYADDPNEDDEGSYAIQLGSGKWVEMEAHNHDDPDHETCELEN